MTPKRNSKLSGRRLFFGKVPRANVLIMSENNKNEDGFFCDNPYGFSLDEWGLCRDQILKPVVDAEIILRRQQAIMAICSLGQSAIEELLKVKWSAYALERIDYLLSIPHTEQDKAEQTQYSQHPYIPKNCLESLLETGFEIGSLMDDKTYDKLSGEHRASLDALREFDAGKNNIGLFAQAVRTIPNPNFVLMANGLDRAVKRSPEITAAVLIELVKAKSNLANDQLDRLKTAIDKLIKPVSEIGMIIGFAYWSLIDEMSCVTFDEDRPQYYQQGWSLAEEKKQSWRVKGQVLCDSCADVLLTIFSGSNMSGKSFGLKRRLLISLCGQTFGIVPAAEANLHLCDNFVFLDRVSTDAFHNLSAFGKEVVQWNKLLTACESGRRSLVLADEAFSTTSAEDQHRLLVGVIEYLIGQGVQLYLACHNQETHAHYANDERCGIYHFETGIAENGDIKFLYRMLPGVDESRALEVAKRLALPKGIIRAAEAFLSGKNPKVAPKPSRFPAIIGYSEEERAKLKAGKRSLFDFDAEANEILLLVTDAGRKLRQRYGKEGYYGRLTDYEAFPKQTPFILALSQDYEVKFSPYVGDQHGRISGEMIRDAVSVDPAEILERRHLFVELAKIGTTEFERLSAEIGRFFIGISVLREKSRDLRWEWSIGQEFISCDFCSLMIDHMRRQYSERMYVSDDAAMAELLLASVKFCCELSGLDADQELFRPFETLSELTGLSRKFREYGFLYSVEDWSGVQEDVKEQALQVKARLGEILQGRSIDEHFKIFVPRLLDELKAKLQPLKLIDCDYERLVKIAEPLKAVYHQTEKCFIFDAAPGFFNSLWALTTVNNPVADFLQCLRQTDSVHLHQYANYLTEIFEVYTDGCQTGPELINWIKQQFEAHKNDDPKEFWRLPRSQYDFNYEWFSMIRRQIGDLQSMAELAVELVDSGNYCPVDFNSTGEVKIEQGWSLCDRKKQRLEQVRNDCHYEPGQLVGELAGTNMSGKTYDLKEQIWITACAQATSFAPASSATMPVYGRAIYIDRVNAKLDANLSAFGTEVELWKALFASLSPDQPCFVAIDEAFSTSSPVYQSALTYGVVWSLALRGERVAIASHNHDFLLRFMSANPKITNINHFQTHVGDDGKIEFDYLKQPGHAYSGGIEVALKLGLPMEIIDIAIAV